MRKFIFGAIIVLFASCFSFSQTSKFTIVLKTALGAVVNAGTVEIICTSNTYPTGALPLTYEHDGIWSRLAVPDGEYSLYYNGTVSPSFQKFYIGEKRLTRIANLFKSNGILNAAIDSVDNISLNTDTLTTRAWIRAQKFGGTIADSLLIVPNAAHFTYTGDTLSIRDTLINQFVKKTGAQTISGTIAFNPTSITSITSNTLTITTNFITLNCAASSVSNISYSNAADGLILIIVNKTTNAVSLANGGNIIVQGGTVSLGQYSSITLIYSNGSYIETGRSLK